MSKCHEPIWDNIRVVATLGVILAHVAAPFTHWSLGANMMAANFFDTISRFAVGSFFLMAGMWALRKQERRGPLKKLVFTYYLKEFCRVILPAAIAIIFYNTVFKGAPRSFSDLCSMFSFDAILGGPYHLWYTWVFTIYIVWTPALRLTMNNQIGRALLDFVALVWFLLAVVGTTLHYWGGWENGKSLVDFLNAWPSLKHWGYFYLGSYLTPMLYRLKSDARLKIRVRALFWLSFGLTLAMPYLLLAIGIADEWHSYRDFERLNIFLLTISSLLLMATATEDFFNNSRDELAAKTYPMYLSHVFFIWLLNPGIKILEEFFPILGIMAEFCLVTGLSYGFASLYRAIGKHLRIVWNWNWNAMRKNPHAPYVRQIAETISSPYDHRNNSERKRDTVTREDQYPLPSTMTISLTRRCNYECVMCVEAWRARSSLVLESEKRDEEREVKFWMELIDATNYKGMEYVFLGGEPLLYKEIEALWDYAAVDHDLNFTIVSNGALIYQFKERFIRSSKARLVLSLNGFANEDEAIRGKAGSFAKVIDFLDFLKKAEPAALKRIAVNCVLLPQNLVTVDYIPEFVQYLQGFGVEVRLQHLQTMVRISQQMKVRQLWETLFEKGGDLPRRDPADRFALDSKQVGRLREVLFRLERMGNMPYVLPNLSPKDLVSYYDPDCEAPIDAGGCCRRPWASPFILADGTLSICPFGGFNVKKLEHGHDFWEAWGSKPARSFRSALIEYGPYSICRNCCDNYQ